MKDNNFIQIDTEKIFSSLCIGDKIDLWVFGTCHVGTWEVELNSEKSGGIPRMLVKEILKEKSEKEKSSFFIHFYNNSIVDTEFRTFENTLFIVKNKELVC